MELGAHPMFNPKEGVSGFISGGVNLATDVSNSPESWVTSEVERKDQWFRQWKLIDNHYYLHSSGTTNQNPNSYSDVPL